MVDVRLTATNPEDSSVVPVACNDAGMIRVEPQVQGPPGQDGEKGDKGDKGDPGDPGQDGQDGQDGDPFTGNFVGDIYLDGTFGVLEQNPVQPVHFNCNVVTQVGRAYMQNCYYDDRWIYLDATKAAGFVNIASSLNNFSVGFKHPDDDNLLERITLTSENKVGIGNREPVTTLDVLGKCGFTDKGELWVTDSRGNKYKTDFVSNTMMQWLPYTPPAQAGDLKDRPNAEPPRVD